ncbi:MAG: glycine cleavage system aminomethyltransferase GcvT, partial [Gemmatimonadota bacterium]|nr:glycine cleavage system aminomethyltransferase GcvT [Gemmatimonadota bacterium]
AHMRANMAHFDCALEDISDDIALLAVQGPNASRIVQSLADVPLDGVKYYWFTEGRVAGVACTISRTGYTGEEGFELYLAAGDAVKVWSALMDTGEVTPAGLGSRDSLRLEAGLSLYGNELDDNTTPIEASLSWLVKIGKHGDFLGREKLSQQLTDGTDRKLVGFTIDERALPRHGYPVWYGDVNVGTVSSGCMSPTLGVPIGTCFLPSAAAVPGTEFEIEIRGKRLPARVVRLPFYKRTQKQ